MKLTPSGRQEKKNGSKTLSRRTRKESAKVISGEKKKSLKHLVNNKRC
jgi:hypothetical protein